MSIKHFSSWCLGLTWIILLQSCMENIDFSSGENLPVVVDCVLKMDSVQTLRLYRMSNMYSGGEEESFSDASVELFQKHDNDKDYSKVAEFKYVKDGKWETTFKPDYGKGYKLIVSIPGMDEIFATTSFPEDLRLVLQDKYIIYKNKKDLNNDAMIYLATTADVASGNIVTKEDFDIFGKLHSFYIPGFFPDSFKAYIPDDTKACKMWIYPHSDSTLVFSPLNYYKGPWEVSGLSFIESSHGFCERVVTDHPGADNFNLLSGTVSDLNIVNVSENSEKGYQWFRLPSGQDLFDLLQYVVPNYAQWCRFLCPNLPIHKQFVRIDHPSGFLNGVREEDLKTSYQFSTSSFLIFGDYDNYSSGVEPFLLEVRFLSNEYDAFLRDLHVKNMSRDNFIISSYDRNNVYTNIHGGVGIFGAENDTWAEKSFFSRSSFEEIIL